MRQIIELQLLLHIDIFIQLLRLYITESFALLVHFMDILSDLFVFLQKVYFGHYIIIVMVLGAMMAFIEYDQPDVLDLALPSSQNIQ